MLHLTFQIGGQNLALDVHRVREVVPRVPLQRPPLAPDWLAGSFVFRGRIVPVVDLHRLMRAGECPEHLSSRIILVAEPGGPADALVGLLAAHVVDVRELPAAAAGGPTVTADGTILHLVDLNRLLPDPGLIRQHARYGGPA